MSESNDGAEAVAVANPNPIVEKNVRFLSDLDRVARAKQQEWANAHPHANPQTNPFNFLRGSDFIKVEFAKLMKPGKYYRTNDDIKQAVNMWCDPNTRAQAEVQYGHISHWDTSDVTDMKGLFLNKRHFNDDISAWDVRKVENMNSMFGGATLFNSDISAWDVAKVTKMNRMFYDATLFNSDISAWDVRNVTDMTLMFNYATSFTSDISAWNVGNVIRTNNIFIGCTIPAKNKPPKMRGGGARKTRRRIYKATRKRRSQRRRAKTSTRRQRR